MLVVKVELHSAIDGHVEELGRMLIANDGSSHDPEQGNYKVFLGRRGSSLNAAIYKRPQREGVVRGHRRLSYSVWRLVAKALHSVGMAPRSSLEESQCDAYCGGCNVCRET
jgi:hypothetical protein